MCRGVREYVPGGVDTVGRDGPFPGFKWPVLRLMGVREVRVAGRVDRRRESG